MNTVIKATETRLEIATKLLNWTSNLVSIERVTSELDVQVHEFHRMSDEEFFNLLMTYVASRDITRIN